MKPIETLYQEALKLSENTSRQIARRTSRRGFLHRFGAVLIGSAALPLLPVARSHAVSTPREDFPGVAPQTIESPHEGGDPTSCDYWRYCGIGGNLCSCCGGSMNACPPGAEMSPITWLGTCRNPVDGKNYIISYSDCCGQPLCSRCRCAPANPRDKPLVRPQASAAYLWCIGTENATYTCSTAVVVGVALDHG